jgi:hypothetical protein
MAITITHPGARLLAPALDTLADVLAGDWASAARLCAARLEDPRECGLDLDVVASRAGVVRTPRQAYDYRLHHRILVVDEHPAVLAAALDLYVRLWTGQWDTLEQVSPAGARAVVGWRPVELLQVRVRHQLPDTWSGRPYATQSLFLAPPHARLAHQVLGELEGGVRHQYDVPAGPAAVHLS